MKRNMGKVFATLLCLFVCLSVYAQCGVDMIVGGYEISAPEAPYGYQEGTCQIKKAGDNLTAVLTLGGMEIIVKEIKKRTESYTCSFYVDGAAVSLEFKQVDKNKLTGVAQAEGMDIPVVFTKKAKAVQTR